MKKIIIFSLLLFTVQVMAQPKVKVLNFTTGTDAWTPYGTMGQADSVAYHGGANITTVGTVTSGSITTSVLNSGTSASSSTFWRGDGIWTDSINRNGIATTPTLGLQLRNNTPSTSGATVQVSPNLSLLGHAWRTNATAADSTVEWFIQNTPISSGTPSGRLDFAFRYSTLNTITTPGTLSSAGLLTILSGLVSSYVSSSTNIGAVNLLGGFASAGGTVAWKLSSGGGNLTPSIIATPNNPTAGGHSVAIAPNNLNNDIAFLIGNGTNYVSRAIIKDTTTSNAAATENGTLRFLTMKNGAAPTEKMNLDSISANLKGTDGTNSAAAGYVGEYVESLVAVGSPVALTTNTTANVTSISLTAGDWDVEGIVNYTEGTATVSARSAGITSTSVTVPSDGSEGYCGVQSTLITEINSITLPRKRILITGTTTIYLVGRATFSAGTCSVFGTINARRVR